VSGFSVIVEGLSDEPSTYALTGSQTYKKSIIIPQKTNATLVLSFIFNDGNNGDKLIGDGETVDIRVFFVEPPSADKIEDMSMEIVSAAVAFLAFIVVAFVLIVRRNALKARLEVEFLQDETNKVRQSFNNEKVRLLVENQNLQVSLRKKKHSEDELEVMKAAMLELTKARSDELKEVLILSKEVKVERLLGKGGFGVVNLATYRGQPIAMKQLLQINEESVQRFRFECLLMKVIRHPSIVKLVGVCWEDDMYVRTSVSLFVLLFSPLH
jgi:hypothetical protein